MLLDLRYALRVLLKARGVTAAAVAALALGIGGVTAIFTIVNAVLLRPLPFHEPQRLVAVQELIPKLSPDPIGLPAPDLVDVQTRNHVFEAVAGWDTLRFDLSGRGDPLRIRAARVSPSLFRILGIAPAAGRTFTNDEDRPDRLVAVLSYALSERLFGGTRAALGQTVRLDRQPYTIVGVMPREFEFPVPGAGRGSETADVWVPLALTAEELQQYGDRFNMRVVALLKPGISIPQAAADLQLVARKIRDEYPPVFRQDLHLSLPVAPLAEGIVGGVRRLLLILLGAVGCVLLIACANVANLLLTRAAGRRQEIAVRAALGAGRARLVRQLLAESLVLGLAGGALGLALAWWGTRALVNVVPTGLPRVGEIRPDALVLAFSLALSLATGVLFGLAPALAAAGANLHAGLRQSGRGSASQRLRGVLAVAEMSLAVVLLIGAGLLVRSFVRLLGADPGFRPAHVLTFSVALPETRYRGVAEIRSFYAALEEKLRAIPGVDAAGGATNLPLTQNWVRVFTPEGLTGGGSGAYPLAVHSVIFGDYFGALGIPLLRGRYLDRRDRAGAAPALVVSASIAQRYWKGQDPLTRRLKWGTPEYPKDSPFLPVAGVVADVKQGSMDGSGLPQIYASFAQMGDDALLHIGRGMRLAVRGHGDAAALASAVQAGVWSLDRDLAVADLRTMNQLIGASLAPRRFQMWLLVSFAGAALLLAAIGIYGVMSYSVAQRTREIGIRMALGADRRDVLGLVLRRALLLSAAGIALGLAAALALGRLLNSLLYGVRPTDAVTFVCVPALLAAVAVAAAFLPARRASRLDPLDSLRYE